MTKKQLRAYLVDISKNMEEGASADMASLIAVNGILGQADIEKLLDEDSRSQLKDIWLKLKSTGAQVLEPPLLFGLPDDFDEADRIADEITVSSTKKAAPKKRKPKKKEEAAQPKEDKEELAH